MGLFDSAVDKFNTRASGAPASVPAKPMPAGFGAHVFSPSAPSARPRRYALWWASEAEPCFVGSPTHDALARAFRAMDGIEGYVLADLLRRVAPEPRSEDGRPALPPRMAFWDVTGPGGADHVLSVSFDKGIRFHHPEGFAGCAAFAEAFAEYAEGWENQVARNGWPRDPAAEVRPLEWLETISRIIGMTEEGGQRLAAVGVVDHAPGTPKVEVDAFKRTPRGLIPTEYPTPTMNRLHTPILLARMEAQAAWLAGKRQPR